MKNFINTFTSNGNANIIPNVLDKKASSSFILNSNELPHRESVYKIDKKMMPESPNSFLKEWDEKNNKENKLPSNPKHKPLNLREQLDQASSDEMV